MGASFNFAWEVLALGTVAALLAMEAEAGAAAFPAQAAPRATLAEAGAAAIPAMVALLVMLAVAGSFTNPAILGPPVVLASLVVLRAPDSTRRRGFRRCRSCWGCLHDGEL